MNKTLVAVVGGVAGIGLLVSYLAQPRTYEDCVLRNMPAPSSDATATAWTIQRVESLCRDKFPLASEAAGRVLQHFPIRSAASGVSDRHIGTTS